MVGNLTSGFGSCFGASMGFAVSAFLAVGNDYWDRFEQDLIEYKEISCGILWQEIIGTLPNSRDLKFPEFRNLLLHYKREKDEPYFNSKIISTSIRFKNSKDAEKVFSFKPAFVNYFVPDNISNLCRTRCY